MSESRTGGAARPWFPHVPQVGPDVQVGTMHAADHTANRRRTISVRASHEQSALPRRDDASSFPRHVLVVPRRTPVLQGAWILLPVVAVQAPDPTVTRRRARRARFASATTAETRGVGFGRCVLVVGDDGKAADSSPTIAPLSARSGGESRRRAGSPSPAPDDRRNPRPCSRPKAPRSYSVKRSFAGGTALRCCCRRQARR